jgi:hypothetical protein
LHVISGSIKHPKVWFLILQWEAQEKNSYHAMEGPSKATGKTRQLRAYAFSLFSVNSITCPAMLCAECVAQAGPRTHARDEEEEDRGG